MHPTPLLAPPAMTSNLDRYVRKSGQLSEQIESLHQKGARLDVPPAERGWQPRFDLYHHGEHVFIDIELPGVPPSALEVNSFPDRVVVRGEKPSLRSLSEREPVVSSREFGQFTSQFALPPGFVLASLEQRLELGVLHLKVGVAPREPALAGS
jgi:HSP20 family molecular chaperone IbpA